MLTFIHSTMGEKGEEENCSWNADTWDANRCEHRQWMIKHFLDSIPESGADVHPTLN